MVRWQNVGSDLGLLTRNVAIFGMRTGYVFATSSDIGNFLINSLIGVGVVELVTIWINSLNFIIG